MGHPPRIPVLIGLNQSVIYFVTFCADGRRHVLDNDDAFAAFRQAITRLDWHITAAVVMPDHVHLLAGPRHRDAAVGSLSAAIKRTIRKRLRADWQWQPGCFDRLLRREESAEEKWEYIRENPVRRRLSFALVRLALPNRIRIVGQAFLLAIAIPYSGKRRACPTGIVTASWWEARKA